MTVETLDFKLRNMHPRFKEAKVEQAAGNADEFLELVKDLTAVQGQIILASTNGETITQEQRDKFDRLRDRVIEVDRGMDVREGKKYKKR